MGRCWLYCRTGVPCDKIPSQLVACRQGMPGHIVPLQLVQCRHGAHAPQPGCTAEEMAVTSPLAARRAQWRHPRTRAVLRTLLKRTLSQASLKPVVLPTSADSG